MSTDHRHASDYLGRLLQQRSQEELAQRLEPKFTAPAPRIPGGSLISLEALDRRW